ncbi:MAG: hypothetical protein IPH03_17200 [Tetrasphaera sp.]|nr:hypothetical protein [Tetrasphaera sp.]
MWVACYGGSLIVFDDSRLKGDRGDGRLYLLGEDGADDDTFVVQTHDAPSGKQLTSTTANRQTGGGYSYPAGILAR